MKNLRFGGVFLVVICTVQGGLLCAGDTWSTIFEKSFSTTQGNDKIMALAEFGGEIYLGAGRSGTVTSANIYRLTADGCKQWEDVTPSWSSATGGYSMAMAVFKNELYVGTDHSEVWRTAGGATWTDATGNWSKGSGIFAMAEFKGYLYINLGTSIWRTADGISWSFMVDLSAKDQKIHDLCSLRVFNGYLYAGTGLSSKVYVNTPQGKVLKTLKGIQLWRTSDGKSWSKFQEEVEPEYSLSTQFYPEHVHALEAFNGYLYVGEYHGKGLYRTDGSATSWSYISDAISAGSGSVFRMLTHAGKLYLGASHLASPDSPGTSGSPLLYVSANGTQWNQATGCPDVDANHSSTTSLLSSAGKLYVGTANNASQSGTLSLWELGPQISADKYEPNDTFATATDLMLGPTSADSSIELDGLTLLENEVDYFKLGYPSSLKQKCFTPFKKDLGSGLYAEINPGYLSIQVQEEYCQPLTFEIYDANKKLISTQQTSTPVKFNCPDLIFTNQTLFIVVTNPDAASPVRYKLTVKIIGWYGQIKGQLRYKFWEYQRFPFPPPPFVKSFIDFIDPITKYFSPGEMLVDLKEKLSRILDFSNKFDRAELDYGLGQMAQLAGQFDEAEGFYRRSLTAFHELGISQKEAEVMRSLGEFYSLREKTKEALESFASAAQLHQSNHDNLGLAHDRMSLGRHYLSKGEAPRSLAEFEEALRLLAGIQDDSGRILNLLCQSEAFQALGMQDASTACIILAEDLASGAGDAALRQEVALHLKSAMNRIGDQEFLQLKKRIGNKATVIRNQAISKVSMKSL